MSKPSELYVVSADGQSQPNPYDTQQLRVLSSDSGRQTELLVLTRDASLIDIVTKAAPSVVNIVTAGDVDEVADKPGLDPGVLVLDSAITNDVHAMLPQLLQHFPEIVIIVVGKRDEISALMRLTASGRVFRFLVLPLAQGQTRLALTSAVAHHLEIRAANVRTGAVPVMETKKSPLGYVALGAGLLVAIAVIWFTIGAFTRNEPLPVAAQQSVDTTSSLPLASQPSEAQTQLQLARDAFEQGNFTAPAGSSALDHYRKARDLQPESSEAQAGIRAVADKILGNAERALTAQQLSEAVQGIEMVRSIDATNPRLQFLDVQIARERDRLKMDQERDRANHVRRLVQQASSHMAAQRLLRPASGNARDALLEARKLDSSDPAVALAITQLTTMLTEFAKRAHAAGDSAQAREFLDGARKLGATEASIAAVERSFSESSRARDNAAARPAPAAPAEKTPQPVVASDKPSAAPTATPAGPTSTAAVNPASSSNEAAPVTQASASRPDQWLQAIDLPRTREVAPDYPTQASINGTEGWVDVDFTISPEGVPDNLRVRDSSPRRVFDRAALDSVRQWRFVPIMENGQPVARRATLRVRFQR